MFTPTQLLIVQIALFATICTWAIVLFWVYVVPWIQKPRAPKPTPKTPTAPKLVVTPPFIDAEAEETMPLDLRRIKAVLTDTDEQRKISLDKISWRDKAVEAFNAILSLYMKAVYETYVFYTEVLKPFLMRTMFRSLRAKLITGTALFLLLTLVLWYLWPVRQLPYDQGNQYANTKLGASRQELTEDELKTRERMLIALKESDILRRPAVVAGFAKVNSWRKDIEAAGQKYDVPPEDLEAIALLESQGDELALNPDKTCRGPFQFDVDTAREYGLTVTVPLSDDPGKDERIDPAKAAEAAARMYAQTRKRYGHRSYAIARHHAGPGNLNQLMNILIRGRSFDPKDNESKRHGPSASDIQARYPTYSHAFFGCSPYWNGEAFKKLEALKDDSSTYYFKVEEIIVLFAEFRANHEAFMEKAGYYIKIGNKDHDDLGRRARYWFWKYDELAKKPYKNKGSLGVAISRKELVPIPEDQGFYFTARTKRVPGEDYIGLLCDNTDPKYKEVYGPRDRPVYFTSREETIGAIIYLSEELKKLRGNQPSPLRINSLVRDLVYQSFFNKGENPVHCYGMAFDLTYVGLTADEHRDIEFILNEMESVGLLSWKAEKYPPHYHVSINPDMEVRSFFQEVYRQRVK